MPRRVPHPRNYIGGRCQCRCACGRFSHGESSRSKNPQVERFEGSPLSGGIVSSQAVSSQRRGSTIPHTPGQLMTLAKGAFRRRAALGWFKKQCLHYFTVLVLKTRPPQCHGLRQIHASCIQSAAWLHDSLQDPSYIRIGAGRLSTLASETGAVP